MKNYHSLYHDVTDASQPAYSLMVGFWAWQQACQIFLDSHRGEVKYLDEDSATTLSGAGGIGLHLADRIRVNNWEEVGFLLIMILLTVTLIDLLSKAIRLRVIHAGASSIKGRVARC